MKVATPLNKACTDMADNNDLRLPSLSPRPPQNIPPTARPISVILPITQQYELNYNTTTFIEANTSTYEVIS